jgi:hypothetical protein
MKTFKHLILTSLLLCCFTLAIGQKSKVENKAKERVETLQQKLSGVNIKYALTPDQYKSAYEVYLEGEKIMSEARKAAKTEEEKNTKLKAIRKEMNTNIRKNVLNKEQRLELNKLAKAK